MSELDPGVRELLEAIEETLNNYSHEPRAAEGVAAACYLVLRGRWDADKAAAVLRAQLDPAGCPTTVGHGGPTVYGYG